MSETEQWLSISDLAAAMDRDKALISRFVAKHQIETRPGRNRTKLVNVARFRDAFEEAEFSRNAARATILTTVGRWNVPQKSGEWNRARLERIAARQELRNKTRRRRRPSI